MRANYVVIAVLDGVVTVCYLVGVLCTVNCILRRIEVCVGTTVNGDSTDVFFALVNVESVISAFVLLLCVEVTAVDSHNSSACRVDCCTATRDKRTVLDSYLCAVDSGDYFYVIYVISCACSCHCTVTGNGNVCIILY